MLSDTGCRSLVNRLADITGRMSTMPACEEKGAGDSLAVAVKPDTAKQKVPLSLFEQKSDGHV